MTSFFHIFLCKESFVVTWLPAVLVSHLILLQFCCAMDHFLQGTSKEIMLYMYTNYFMISRFQTEK